MKYRLCALAAAFSIGAIAQQPTQPGQSPAAQPTTPQPSSQGAAAGGKVTQGLSNLLTEWRLEDLPAAAQKTVREQAGGQKIADIDREDRTGRTIWEVEFEQPGRNKHVHVADDGTVIPENQAHLRVGTQTRTPSAGAPGTTQTESVPAGLDLGTQWEDLPKAVQDKAMQYGGKAKIADIDRENWNGNLAYEVEFQRQGRNLEIYFDEEGAILYSNDPASAPFRGAPAAGEQGRNQSPVQPRTTQPEPQLTPDPIPNPDPGVTPPLK
jgi:uncharacterized membrane protein YkoI